MEWTPRIFVVLALGTVLGLAETNQYHPLPLFDNPWISEYYGLTTFSGAPPQRCFGLDRDQAFDVAILGE